MSELTQVNIDILKASRATLLKEIDEIPREKWTIIPPGYKTNLLWNLGHVVVSQQVLLYLFSGVPMHISEDLFPLFRKGTNPAEWEKTPDAGAILEDLSRLPELLQEDYNKGVFTRYRKYTTELGVRISNIDEAIPFNNYHEGLHLGITGGMKKQLL